MISSSYVIVLSGVLVNVVAQLLLKAGTQQLTIDFTSGKAVQTLLAIFFQPHILAGLTCYFISSIIWIAALSKLEVSIAYPMLSIGYVITTGMAWFLFGEAITTSKVVGTALILLGVIVLTR